MYERFSLLLGRVFALDLNDLKREEGQTTVEYGLVILVGVALAAALLAALKTPVVTAIVTKITDAVASF